MDTKSNQTAAESSLPGRRERKALAVRHALFHAGLAAFERQPMQLVSVLDITEAADVAKGVFYLQFSSKDDYLLELWAYVQQQLLDAIKVALAGENIAPALQDARIAIAAKTFHSFASGSVATTRFWKRMSSYFPDEIGPPGELVRVQQEYSDQLASIIADKPIKKLTRSDLQVAITLDTLCWAVGGIEAHGGDFKLDQNRLVLIIETAIAALKEQPAKRNRIR